MAIKIKIIRGVALIKLKGSFLEGEELEEVRLEVQSLIGEGSRSFVFDFSRVNRLNSNGLGMLLACYSMIHKVRGRTGITGLTDPIENVLNITKIITLFDRFGNIRNGIRSYQ